MNKTFEPYKNAKELGIDITREFVVVNGDGVFGKGQIITLYEDDDTRCPKFKNDSGREGYMRWSQLAYADRTLRDMKVGDVIVGKGGGEAKVLAVLGDVFLRSGFESFDEAWQWHTFSEAEDFRLKYEPTEKKIKEVTMAEVCEKFGEEVKIIKE